MKKILHYLTYMLLMLTTLSACTQVKPWQRGHLALPQMALESDVQEAVLRQHTFFSKESASGGYGGGGGGCGCN
jgi:predicted small lipoprotein YifL